MGVFNPNVRISNSNLKKNLFNRDSVHITTNDFFFLCPALSREVMRDEDIKVDMSVFSRATPLYKPAYVDVSIKSRAFFVPYHSVFPQFNDFLTDNRSPNQFKFDAVPYFGAMVFYNMIMADDAHTYAASTDQYNIFANAYTGSDDKCDIVIDFTGDTSVPSADRVKKRYNFTALGKHFWAVLTGIGYNLPLHCRTTTVKTLPNMSVLPLICMLRIWSDWYRPTNFETAFNYLDSGTSSTLSVDTLFTAAYWENTLTLLPAHLWVIAQWLTMIPYERDYYNCAQPLPLGSSTSGSISMTDPAASYGVSSTSGGVPVASTTDPSGTLPGVTKWTVNALAGLSNWMRRNQIAGYRTLDRYLAQYGTKLNSESLERSVYLGEQVVPLMVSAVMSQTDSYDSSTGNGAYLGDYAGSATVDPRNAQGGSFSYSASEFGHFIIVSQFIPKVSYYQGIKREMFHVGRFDFFNGDFDNLAYQAMPLAELCNMKDLMDGNVASVNLKSVYGYVPRYAEYKQSTNQDVLDGDFRVYRSGANSYKDMHLFRELPFKASMSVERQYEIASWSSAQFDRIFANQSDVYDHFLTYFTFKVESWMPCSRLYENFSPETTIGHGESDIHVGGSQFE